MLGDLSAKYESNGNPGAISTGSGDLGGKSYGCYQLAINTGAVHSFLAWLRETGHTYGQSLAKLEPGTQNFDALWRTIARSDGQNFAALQHEYIKEKYYDPAVFLLSKNYFNVEKHTEIMQDVVWSRAVQYAPGNVVELFTEAAQRMGHPNLSYVDAARFDWDIIANIYNFLIEECDAAHVVSNGLYHSPRDWVNGSADVVAGLRNRFIHERNEALNQL